MDRPSRSEKRQPRVDDHVDRLWSWCVGMKGVLAADRSPLGREPMVAYRRVDDVAQAAMRREEIGRLAAHSQQAARELVRLVIDDGSRGQPLRPCRLLGVTIDRPSRSRTTQCAEASPSSTSRRAHGSSSHEGGSQTSPYALAAPGALSRHDARGMPAPTIATRQLEAKPSRALSTDCATLVEARQAPGSPGTEPSSMSRASYDRVSFPPEGTDGRAAR